MPDSREAQLAEVRRRRLAKAARLKFADAPDYPDSDEQIADREAGFRALQEWQGGSGA